MSSPNEPLLPSSQFSRCSFIVTRSLCADRTEKWPLRSGFQAQNSSMLLVQIRILNISLAYVGKNILRISGSLQEAVAGVRSSAINWGGFCTTKTTGPSDAFLGIQLSSHICVDSSLPILLIMPYFNIYLPSRIASQIYDGLGPSSL